MNIINFKNNVLGLIVISLTFTTFAFSQASDDKDVVVNDPHEFCEQMLISAQMALCRTREAARFLLPATIVIALYKSYQAACLDNNDVVIDDAFCEYISDHSAFIWSKCCEIVAECFST